MFLALAIGPSACVGPVGLVECIIPGEGGGLTDDDIRILDFINNLYATRGGRNAGVCDNVTVAQISNGLDEFYKDYRNTQIRILDAMPLVCMEAKGAAKDKVERKARILRMPPDQQAIERLKDDIGKIVERGLFPRYEIRKGSIVDKKTNQEVLLDTMGKIVSYLSKARSIADPSGNKAKTTAADVEGE